MTLPIAELIFHNGQDAVSRQLFLTVYLRKDQQHVVGVYLNRDVQVEVAEDDGVQDGSHYGSRRIFESFHQVVQECDAYVVER